MTEVGVTDFIQSYVENEQKKADSFQLIELMSKWSGFEPKKWEPTMIGFGTYHYKYASEQEGDAPMTGFSPRKAAFSLYVYSQTEDNKHLLDDFETYKISKACISVKKLADIDIDTLEKMCMLTIAYLNEHHECECRN